MMHSRRTWSLWAVLLSQFTVIFAHCILVRAHNSAFYRDIFSTGPARHYYRQSGYQERPQSRQPSPSTAHECGLAPLNRQRGGPTGRSGHRDGSPDIGEYIDGGHETSDGEFPSFVMLETERPGGGDELFRCGGTLISDRHILTASHCIQDFVGQKVLSIEASIGGFVKGKFYRKSLRVKSYCDSTDRGWQNENSTSDWAVLTLERPVTFSDHVQPACLPNRNRQPITNGTQSNCYAVGWGATYANPKLVDGVIVYDHGFPKNKLFKLKVEKKNCDMRYNIGNDDVGRSCYGYVGEEPGGVCPGDSGGPALCTDKQGRWTIMGVLILGVYNCHYFTGEVSAVMDTNKMQLDPRFEMCMSKSGAHHVPLRPPSRGASRIVSRVYLA